MSQTSQTFPKLPTLLRRLRVEQDILGKKRVPYKTLAKKYAVSERTIKTDAQWIKSQLPLPFIQKAVSEKVVTTLDILDERKDKHIILKYCLGFLARGLPQKIEAFSYEKIDKTVTLNVTENEDEILSKAASILTRKTKPSSVHGETPL